MADIAVATRAKSFHVWLRSSRCSSHVPEILTEVVTTAARVTVAQRLTGTDAAPTEDDVVGHRVFRIGHDQAVADRAGVTRSAVRARLAARLASAHRHQAARATSAARAVRNVHGKRCSLVEQPSGRATTSTSTPPSRAVVGAPSEDAVAAADDEASVALHDELRRRAREQLGVGAVASGHRVHVRRHRQVVHDPADQPRVRCHDDVVAGLPLRGVEVVAEHEQRRVGVDPRVAGQVLEVDQVQRATGDVRGSAHRLAPCFRCVANEHRKGVRQLHQCDSVSARRGRWQPRARR